MLEKTWGVITQNNQIDLSGENFEIEMLLISSDITFSDVDINGDSGTATISLDQSWRIIFKDGDVIDRIEYTSLNLNNKTINMTRSGNNKWRCYFASSGDTEEEETILKGSVLNVQVTSSSSLHIIQDGIVYLHSTDGNSYAFVYNQNELDYWEK